MKITRIYIKNFRSIKEVTILPQSMMCLVGENNAGKSNILKAIDFLLGEGWPSDINREDIFQNNEDLEVKIQIDIELKEEEKTDIQQYRGKWSDGNIIGVVFHRKPKEQRQSDKRSENIIFRLLTNSSNQDKQLEYPSTEIKQILSITYIGANRDIERHLGYGSKWTFMSKLADKFEKELERMQKESEEKGEEGLKTKIQKTFTEVQEQFKEVEKFRGFDDSLQQFFADHLPNTATEKRFDVSVSFRAYNPISYFKSLSLIPRDNGKEIDLSQLGDGLKTILLLSYFKAYAEAFKNSSVLMIEEPEIYLHPHLRRHIFDMFQELSDKSGVQVFFTTHSPDFVDVPRFENIAIVVKEDKKTAVRQAVCKDVNSLEENDLLRHIKQLSDSFGVSSNPTEESTRERLRLFYRLEQNEAFFAKKIVLVEGQTEFFSLPIYAKAQGFSFNKEGITIVNCGAKNNIPFFYCLFKKCFGLPTYVIVDGDKSKVEATESTKKQNPALNRYLQKMVGILVPVDTLKENRITESYAFFSEDFEDFIESQFSVSSVCSAIRSEAKKKYGGKGEHKWFIQRYLASQLTEKDDSENCKYDTGFEDLKSIINFIFSHSTRSNAELGKESSDDTLSHHNVPF